MKNIWNKMDMDVKLLVIGIALYLTIYVVADVCEWICGVML